MSVLLAFIRVGGDQGSRLARSPTSKDIGLRSLGESRSTPSRLQVQQRVWLPCVWLRLLKPLGAHGESDGSSILSTFCPFNFCLRGGFHINKHRWEFALDIERTVNWKDRIVLMSMLHCYDIVLNCVCVCVCGKLTLAYRFGCDIDCCCGRAYAYGVEQHGITCYSVGCDTTGRIGQANSSTDSVSEIVIASSVNMQTSVVTAIASASTARHESSQTGTGLALGEGGRTGTWRGSRVIVRRRFDHGRRAAAPPKNTCARDAEGPIRKGSEPLVVRVVRSTIFERFSV